MPAGLVGTKGYLSDATVAHCNSTYGGCFTMAGSDTLTNVAQGAIAGAGACLSYHNVGSTQGESNMIFGATGANTGTLSSRTQSAYQGFAPMSRNFTSAIRLNATVASEGWEPSQPDTAVVGIDGAVVTFQPMTGQCVDLDDTMPATCAAACAGAASKGISALAVLVGGMPASGTISNGTTAECSDRRLPGQPELPAGQPHRAHLSPRRQVRHPGHLPREDHRPRRQPGQVLVQRQVRGQQQLARRQHQERGSGPDSSRLRC
jgi:hypothetical protein